ncbi:unnamed protein product [Caenorhabditis bovis]|uniref:Piezo TM1-24 domain-containing protein n=1 Tax=Caenorhabditis bovis TaxID=2654633 RepID=A0A8S1F688_9PELO|nr:unnamed protein product [Caenorhabditis bovis]
MTVPPWFKSFALKFVLPVAFLAAAIIRPCFFSILYVALALTSAILPSIRAHHALPKIIGTFVTIAHLVSLGIGLGVTSYQISEHVIHKNSTTYICNRADTTFFRSLGLVRFHSTGTFESVRAYLPEVISVTTSLVVFVVVMFCSHRNQNLDIVGDVVSVRDSQTQIQSQNSMMWKALLNSLRRLTNFLIVMFMAYVGVVKPSLANFVYFAAFLFFSTWWSTYKPLRHSVYNKVKLFLILFAGLHVILLYSYQIPIVHNSWIPKRSAVARLLGLNILIDAKCPEWWKYPFVAPDFDSRNLLMKWPLYANPIVFYYALVIQYKFTKNGSRQYFDDHDIGSSVHEERFASAGTVESHVDDEPEHLITIGETQTTTTPSSTNGASRGRGNTLLLGNDPDHESSTQPSDTQTSIPMRKVTSQVDRSKLNNIFNANREQESAASKGMIAVISFVIYHAYSLALTAMMVWALLYHSIFGLILLIITCVLWIFRDTRKAAFTISPLILAYIEFLLLLQYVLSMDVHNEIGDPKWMDFVGIHWMKIPSHALVILCVQTLLSLPVFLLVRLARREKYYASLSDFERQRRIQSYGTFGGTRAGGGVAVAKDPKSRKLAAFVKYCSTKISTYFIFVVSLTLLIVATYAKPTFYNIGFFAIWALSIVYLKISFRLFRGVAYVFWLSLTFYTSLVIIILYIYQFKGVAIWLQNTTGLSKDWLETIGLVDYSAIGESGTLFLRLFAPICLFVVTMLQLKFFHDAWQQAVSPIRADAGDSRTPSMQLLRRESSSNIFKREYLS